MRKIMFRLFELDEAIKAATEVIKKAQEEIDRFPSEDIYPISVAIVDLSRKTVVLMSMDGATPLSAKLAQDKANSAIKTGRNTIELELMKTNPANIKDPEITFFA